VLLAIIILSHVIGVATAVGALMKTRTPQGTMAWILALVAVPYLAVPAYWILGPSRFEGYVSARRGGDSRLRDALSGIEERSRPFRAAIPETRGGIRAVERLARMPVLLGNRTRLLIDGEATFDSIFQGIEDATEYVLVQFYTIADDGVGNRLRDSLIRKAREGVRVYLLFDRIGSHRLPRSWVRSLRTAGVHVQAFLSSRAVIRQRFRPRLQINFRNHRKIVVVDGREGWLGGLNAADAYLGLDPEMGPWRDTHMKVEGPAVLGLQLSFLEDWHWSAEEILELDWEPRPVQEPGEAVLILPSGPADPLETASLMVHHAIHAARERLWIASPYFVPDEGVLAGLKLAALRGVDVRILVPARADVPLVHLAKLAVLPPLLDAGVQVLQYEEGFLHTKAFLVDDRAAGVGTVNLDNRSFRLNFEITALLMDSDAVARVEAMFRSDFRRAGVLTAHELSRRPFLQKAAARAAHLLAPIL
jgi:cardiolipin synthase A/B